MRRTEHAGHCWRSRGVLISDVLLWTPTYGRAKAGRPARTYIQQLCEDTGCSPKDLPEAMNDREKRRERVGDIRAGGTTWWCWWHTAQKSNFTLKYQDNCFSFSFRFFCFPVYPHVDIAVIGCCNLSFFVFLVYFSSPRIDASMLRSMLMSLLSRSFLDTCHLSSVKPCALSSISLSFGPSVWVPSLSILRKVRWILLRGLFGFEKCFSFFRNTLLCLMVSVLIITGSS